MDKLEYDSLHKFLVSLGIILIALPFTLLIYILNTDIALISQVEYEQLSQYSKHNLNQKDQLFDFIIKIIPFVLIVMFVTGVVFIIIGIKNWKKVQKNLDALIEAERTQKELDASTMKNSEILAKAESEVKEIETSEPSNAQRQFDRISKYIEIEERYFSNALSTAFRRRHIFKRNVRIEKYEYDAIAVSTENKCDTIFEIKYWHNPMNFSKFNAMLHKLYEAGINYQQVQQRDFKYVLAIVAPKDSLEKIRNMTDKFMTRDSNSYNSKISIQYVAEEDI